MTASTVSRVPLVLAVTLAVAACNRPTGAPPAPDAYVADADCGSCHEAALRAWTGSHHDRAMEEATPATVLGDFGDVTAAHGGTTTRFFRRDDAFFADAVGPDGARHDYPIRYTFGVDPLQQYLVELPGGHLQALTVAWDTSRHRWFDLYPDERPPPGDPLHWTGLYLNWNAQCAECHSTGVRKNYDAAADTYRTTWAAIDVGCQACHGPGAAHVARARSHPGASLGTDTGLVAAYRHSDARREVESCAPCHARRHRVSGEDGRLLPFFDHYLPETLRAGLYHPDGQIEGEVYEYGSFVQSRMYARGVRCSDCHDPHAAGLHADGDATCTRCHNPDGNPRFPSLVRSDYDTPAHHFHPPGSSGARCVACHMPSRFYMVVDERHDHSLRIPRPDLSDRLGTPNACTACHREGSNRWAAEQIAAHRPARTPGPHAGETLALARAGQRSAGPALLTLASDPSVAAIFRATALEFLPAYGSGAAHALVAASSDPDPLLRATAVGELDHVGPDARRAAVARLADPIRAVRVEAARVLASTATAVPAPDQAAFDRALAEYRATLAFEADGPSSHLNQAVLAAAGNRADEAEREYRTALRLDARFLPARFNLAMLLNARQRNVEAETVLRDGIALAPDDGELHYSRGLLLAEMGRDAEAVAALGRAAELLPGRPRAQYNYALALTGRGRQDEAERALLAAWALDPGDAEIGYALVVHYLQRGRRAEATRFADAVTRLGAPSPEAARVLESLAGR